VRFNGLKLKRRLIPGEIENVDEIGIVHALFKGKLTSWLEQARGQFAIGSVLLIVPHWVDI
jgi:hypothetical protein